MTTVKKTKTELLKELYIEPVSLTGSVNVNLDVLEQLWDYRFVLYKLAQYDLKNMNAEPTYYYRLVRFLRKGSPLCTKVTVSNETAEEIIERLKLVFQPAHMVGGKGAGSYRQEGFSEFDLMKKMKK